MEIYEKAYKRYIEKCEQFSINKIDLVQFVKNVTEEQAKMMLNELH